MSKMPGSNENDRRLTLPGTTALVADNRFTHSSLHKPQCEAFLSDKGATLRYVFSLETGCCGYEDLVAGLKQPQDWTFQKAEASIFIVLKI